MKLFFKSFNNFPLVGLFHVFDTSGCEQKLNTLSRGLSARFVLFLARMALSIPFVASGFDLFSGPDRSAERNCTADIRFRLHAV